MKKIILFVILVLLAQISYRITPLLARENDEGNKIRKVIEKFFEDFANGNLNSMMKQVSLEFSYITPNGEVMDYDKFKSKIEELMGKTTQTYVDWSFADLEIINLEIKDNNKATLETKIGWKGFNLGTLKDNSGEQKSLYSLAKENGIWKITRWIRF